MRTGIIYGYMNKENGKWYVGQTICPNKRKKEHIRNQKKYEKNNFKNGRGMACPKFYRAVSKYGWDSFEYIILEKAILLKDLDSREVFWGTEKNCIKNGYNLALGGAGNKILSKEILKSMSKRVKGKKILCMVNAVLNTLRLKK